MKSRVTWTGGIWESTNYSHNDLLPERKASAHFKLAHLFAARLIIL
uniref:Uncharacterized protein n=1 Tax=Arundo donax TaxID=35708 RepID=A0A0A9B5N0_ARUDO